jgi:hypothetical protein
MAKRKLEPTVTIGGAPAGYKPVETGTPFGQAPVKKSTEQVLADVNKTIGELTPEYFAGIQESIKAANDAVAAAQAAGDEAIAAAAIATKPQVPAQLTSDLYTQQRLDRLSEEQKSAERTSAFNILKMEFDRYGLGSLVDNIKGLLQENIPASEFSLRLRETPAYQQRFSANKDRISTGLSALSPAEYVALEDQYQNIMRNYGLPASYYTKDATGKQSGFDKFIAGDVSATELEDRVATAQKRVLNANPEVSTALKQFYPDITNGDILAYTLDPSQGLEGIKRKVTAAEIGGAAIAQGLQTGVSRAEELAKYGVTAQQAQQGFQAVADIAPRATMLSDIYGETPYGQAQAETEVFNLAGAAESAKQRKKLVGLEKAAFSASSGAAAGALGRERAMGQGQI